MRGSRGARVEALRALERVLAVGTAVAVCVLLPAARASDGGTEHIITTIAGTGIGDGGPATAANLVQPTDVAVDAQGNIYIADYGNWKVRRVDAATGKIATLAQYPAIGRPHSVDVDAAGNVFAADDWAYTRVWRIDAVTGQVTTAAGNGLAGYSGDGGPATQASLYYPSDAAVDSAGNLFIADPLNCRVRRVDAPTGVITTVAGTGEAGYSGDGGQATAAKLFSPTHVALDAAGNLYIADTNSFRVRRVDAGTGIITTIAGPGRWWPWATRGDAGLAVDAGFRYVAAVEADPAGNVYVTDAWFEECRIRRIDAATGIITSVAGEGRFGFSGDGGPATAARLAAPVGTDIDAAGNLFIADTYNHVIRRVDAATGTIATVAGNGLTGFAGDGGPATACGLVYPMSVNADSAGNVYVTDYFNWRVRRVDRTSGIIATVAGDGVGQYGPAIDGVPATDSPLSPMGVCFDREGALVIADQTHSRIRRVDPVTGVISTVVGTGTPGYAGDGGPASEAQLNDPLDVKMDAAGNFFIADQGNHRIRRVDAVTNVITTVVGTGTPGFSGDGQGDSTQLWSPTAVALDGDGNAFIADYHNQRIRLWNASSGAVTTVAGGGAMDPSYGSEVNATQAAIGTPYGVAVDGGGNVFFSRGPQVFRVDAADGTIRLAVGKVHGGFEGDGGPATQARIFEPHHIALDDAGDLLIADTANRRIRRVVGIGVPRNHAPVAAAGEDCTVEAGAGAAATLTLDGTGSFDPEDDALSFTWTGPFGTANGATPTVALPLGTSSILLTVSDGRVTAADTIDVTVADTAPPSISVASPDEGAVLGASSVTVVVAVVDATPTEVRIGDAVQTVADWGGTASLEVPLVPGPNALEVVATDGAGHTARTELTVVFDPEAPVIWLDTPIDGRPVGARLNPVAVVAHVEDMTATRVVSSPPGISASLGALGGLVTGEIALREGSNAITLTATDDAGHVSSATVTVILDTVPPVLALPSVAPVEAVDANGAPVTFDVTANDAVSGDLPVTASAASGSVFPLATTTVSCEAVDEAGNVGRGTFDVVVRDTTPPVIREARPSTATLWPPDHQMVDVTIAVTAADAVGVFTSRIVSIESNEPVNGLGDGDAEPDWVVTGDLSLSLRAERSGKGSGREYTITVECSDGAGNRSRTAVVVSVPKSQGR